MPLTPIELFNRMVRCHCGSREVVSRMVAERDPFVVCSQGCFDSMVSQKPHYFEVTYGRNSYVNKPKDQAS